MDQDSQVAASAPEVAPPSPDDAVAGTWRNRLQERAGKLRRNRMLVLTLALVGVGLLGTGIGSVAGPHLFKPPAAASAPAPKLATSAELKALGAGVAQLKSEITAMRAAGDASGRSGNAHVAKLTERLERIERAQAEPAAKLAKLSEAIDRLEKSAQTAAARGDVTGSVPQTAAAQPPREAQREAPAPILEGWRIRNVYDGAALLQSRRFGLVEVMPGDVLPGGIRVERIHRRDGRWIVVTARGVIVASR